MVTDGLDSSKEQQKGENVNDGCEVSHAVADNESQANDGQQAGNTSGGCSYHDTSDRRIYMSQLTSMLPSKPKSNSYGST